tara:strand:- start:75881 stop:76765 length:885 start_codon:yes stop_codon:yes gene_type:complete
MTYSGNSQKNPFYLTEHLTKEYPLLTRQLEIDYFLRIEAGDKSARQVMVKSNQRLVMKMALAYRRKTNAVVSLEDLLHEGNIGLMRAIEDFDLTRGFKFSTYAIHWVRQSIQRSIEGKAKTVRLPAYIHGMLGKIQKATDQYFKEHGIDPSYLQLAEFMQEAGMKQYTEEKIKEIMIAGSASNTLSLEEMSENEDDFHHKNPVSQPIQDPEEQGLIPRGVRSLELENEVGYFLDRLTERERRILTYRYGLDGNEPMTLKEIGAMEGFTKERARQWEEKIMIKLKEIAQEQVYQE